MRQASEDAVLNANYIRAGLARPDVASPSATSPACTRCCSTTTWLEGTGVTTLDFAKAMIDEGYHPMTMYFPLVVHGAMLIEPTESESKASLDLFIATLRDLAHAGEGAARPSASTRRRCSPRAAASTRPRRAPAEAQMGAAGALCRGGGIALHRGEPTQSGGTS